MLIVKEFKNVLGYVKLEKDADGKYLLTMNSDFARLGHFNVYEYRADAMAQYQFYCYWLTSNEHVITGVQA